MSTDQPLTPVPQDPVTPVETAIPSIEEIHSAEMDGGDGLIGIVIRRHFTGDPGVRFFTGPGEAQQVGYVRYPGGHVIPAHVHRDRTRTVHKTQEVLLVRKGTLLVTFYTSAGEVVTRRGLSDGDVCVLLGGGHAVQFVTDTDLIEVKQGPYAGKELDKRML